MTYAGIETVNATNDLTELLVYMNLVTGGAFMPSALFAFFMIILLSSVFSNLRFSGSSRFDISFAVAGFATFGLAVIMSSRDGLLNFIFLLISLVIAIIGVAWIYFNRE